MDSWSSGIARNIIFGPEDDPNGYAAGIGGVIFFITYIFGAGIVMTNVVVAILLEKYLKVTSGKLEITDNVLGRRNIQEFFSKKNAWMNNDNLYYPGI